jgi:hypothetical protein
MRCLERVGEHSGRAGPEELEFNFAGTHCIFSETSDASARID